MAILHADASPAASASLHSLLSPVHVIPWETRMCGSLLESAEMVCEGDWVKGTGIPAQVVDTHTGRARARHRDCGAGVHVCIGKGLCLLLLHLQRLGPAVPPQGHSRQCVLRYDWCIVAETLYAMAACFKVAVPH